MIVFNIKTATKRPQRKSVSLRHPLLFQSLDHVGLALLCDLAFALLPSTAMDLASGASFERVTSQIAPQHNRPRSLASRERDRPTLADASLMTKVITGARTSVVRASTPSSEP